MRLQTQLTLFMISWAVQVALVYCIHHVCIEISPLFWLVIQVWILRFCLGNSVITDIFYIYGLCFTFCLLFGKNELKTIRGTSNADIFWCRFPQKIFFKTCSSNPDDINMGQEWRQIKQAKIYVVFRRRITLEVVTKV